MFPRYRRRGLRIKIIAWSFVPTALALVAVGLVSFYAFQRTTRFLLIERNRELVRLTAAQLTGKVDEYVEVLSRLTRSPAFSSRIPGDKQAALQLARNSLVVFDGGVIVTDELGLVIAAEPERPEVIGQDWSNRGYFRELVRVREPVYSNIVADGPGGVKSIVIAVPITGDQGELLGMAAGMFRLGATRFSSFYGSIIKLRIGVSDDAHLNTYLVDRNGQVIYHTDSVQIGDDFSTLQAVQHLSSSTFVDEFSEMAPEQGGFLGSAGALRTFDVEGREVVAYYSAVPGTPWGLVSEASWSGLLLFYQNYLIVQSLLFVLGVVLPALVVSYGIRRITEPIYRLMTAAKEVAQGNFGQEIRVTSGDELEELVEQFNHMSIQLSQSYAAIQEREERFALVMQGTNDGIWDWNIQAGQVYYSPRWKSMLGYADQEIANQFDEWLRLIHPDDIENANASIKAHLEGGESLFQLEHRLRHKDGSYRWILARGITVREASGKPQRMVGSHSDITPRKHAEEALRKAYETLEERVQERTRELATLNEVSALVNRSLDLNEILSDVLDKMLEITKMEFGAVYRLEGDRENEWLSPEEAAGLGAEHLFLNPLVYRGITEQSSGFASRLHLIVSGVGSLFDLDAPLLWKVQASSNEQAVQEALQTQGIEQVVTIPLRVKGRLLGAIQLGGRQVRSFTPEELDLLAAIGQQVGVVMENARLHEADRERLQHTTTLEERARLARELHDSVTQSLYSVNLLAEAAARLLTAGDNLTAAEHLRELRDTAQESLREMRLLIYELRPVALEKSGLADALRLRLEAVEARSGIKTELHVEGVEQLSYTTKEELYHIAQESLNNVLKHSHANKVQVNIRFHDPETCLEIMDDGVGFEPEQATRCGGMGLSGIAERAHKIGGKLQVESAPGKGTRVSVVVGKLGNFRELGGTEGNLREFGELE